MFDSYVQALILFICAPSPSSNSLGFYGPTGVISFPVLCIRNSYLTYGSPIYEYWVYNQKLSIVYNGGLTTTFEDNSISWFSSSVNMQLNCADNVHYGYIKL